MRNKLLLSAALALLAVGCKTLEPKPDQPPSQGAGPGPAPKPPPTQYIPDTGGGVNVPTSTQIVVGLCPATQAYTALGVDTQSKRFTFFFKGGRPSQSQVFNQFYAARVPVIVYTGPVKVRAPVPAPTPAPSPTPATPPDASAPTPPPAPEPAPAPEEPTFDPCAPIGDPVPDPERQPTGSKTDEQSELQAFRDLAWGSAHAVDEESDPVPGSTVPTPE